MKRPNILLLYTDQRRWDALGVNGNPDVKTPNHEHRDIHPDYGFDHLEISDEPGCYEDAYRAWVRRKASGQLDRISVGLPPATAVWYETMGVQDEIKHRVAGGRSDFEGARIVFLR